MQLHQAHALRRGVFMWLVLPASSLAQIRPPQTPTVFSASSQLGAVNIRAAIVLADYTVKPLPHLTIVAQRVGSADSIAGVTGLEGNLVMTLPVGSYTIRAVAPVINGQAFSWAVPVVVRQAATQRVELTDLTASRDTSRTRFAAADAVTGGVVASADSRRSLERLDSDTALSDRPPSRLPRRRGVASDSGVLSIADGSLSTAGVRANQSRHYRANTRGPFVGIGVDASGLRSTDLGVQSDVGFGASASAGWGITRRLAVFGSMSRASMARPNAPYRLAHVDARLRSQFVTATRALVPSLDVAYSRRAAAKLYYDDTPVSGDAFSAGAGLEYFVSRTAALGATVRWMGGEFSRIGSGAASVNGFELDASSARLEFGFTWYPVR
jgi:hypothetical protein